MSEFRRSIAQITSEQDHLGTGFAVAIVRGYVFTLTCYHAIAPGLGRRAKIQVNAQAAEPVIWDKESDLAILVCEHDGKLQKTKIAKTNDLSYTALTLCGTYKSPTSTKESPMFWYSEIPVMVTPPRRWRGNQKKFRMQIVETQPTERIEKGNSGGPLYNESGEVVGVLSTTIDGTKGLIVCICHFDSNQDDDVVCISDLWSKAVEAVIKTPHLASKVGLSESSLTEDLDEGLEVTNKAQLESKGQEGESIILLQTIMQLKASNHFVEDIPISLLIRRLEEKSISKYETVSMLKDLEEQFLVKKVNNRVDITENALQTIRRILR